MTSIEADMETPLSPAAPVPPGPGASLKAARERKGLSLDEAAQALKLAPRQIKALENEDFGQLPGRTFARGFVRNYARLLNLDGEALVAQLPDASHEPALASPSLRSTGATIGEVPATRVARPAFLWLVPVALVTLIAGAGGYEWYRNRAPSIKRIEPTTPAAAVAPAPTAGTARSELANPLTAPPSNESPKVESLAPTASAAPATLPGSSVPVARATVPAASAPAPSASDAAETPAAAATPTASPAAPAAAGAEAPLVLNYRAPAWTQVRDARGQVLVSRVVPAGSEQPVRGTPPFEVTIGNARAVTVVYRGQEVDLARYTRQNVARLRLP